VPTYQVRLTEPAEAELSAAYLSRSRFTSPAEALRWHNGLLAAAFALADGPRRWARVDAADYGYSAQIEVRRLLYGKGRGAWHVVYQVIEPGIGAETRKRVGPGADPDDPDDPDGLVRVLHVVSAVRRPLGDAGLTDADPSTP